MPVAVRATTPGWRDPRLWIGVAIVAASVLVGARVLASADDTVAVWSADRDIGVGERLTPDDLVVTRVHFTDDTVAAGYVAVDDELPDDVRVLRLIGAGELVSREAVGVPGETGLQELPLAVEPEQVPGGVSAGDVVDVYVLGTPRERAAPAADHRDGPVLSGVTVVDAPALADSFGTSGRRQLVVAVPAEVAADYFELIGSLETPVLTVVGHG